MDLPSVSGSAPGREGKGTSRRQSRRCAGCAQGRPLGWALRSCLTNPAPLFGESKGQIEGSRTAVADQPSAVMRKGVADLCREVKVSMLALSECAGLC